MNQEKTPPTKNAYHNRKIVKLSAINEHFQCGICQGYIIDATTIIDCLHSFCKSCIVHFIQTIDHRCPTCNCNLNDVKNCLRTDSSLQRLIYKLIPNLLETELDRREKFKLKENLKSELILNDNTLLNIVLFNSQNENNLKKIRGIVAKENHLKNSSGSNEVIPHNVKQETNKPSVEELSTKYIQCIAQTPIKIFSKLIRNKYNIPHTYKVKLYHEGHKLEEEESLIQVFTSFILDKHDTFQINYEITKSKYLKNIKNTIDNYSNIKNKTEQDIGANISLTNKSNIKQEPATSKVNTDFLKVKFRRQIGASHSNSRIANASDRVTKSTSSSSLNSLASKNKNNTALKKIIKENLSKYRTIKMKSADDGNTPSSGLATNINVNDTSQQIETIASKLSESNLTEVDEKQDIDDKRENKIIENIEISKNVNEEPISNSKENNQLSESSNASNTIKNDGHVLIDSKNNSNDEIPLDLSVQKNI